MYVCGSVGGRFAAFGGRFERGECVGHGARVGLVRARAVCTCLSGSHIALYTFF